MSANAISKFRTINDFPELVEYLGDELDWPIQTDDFEEMTFDYSAEELGLDAKTAPKFLEIRRLRPLDKDQPWGIFFIRFEESKLPVVALRRLLGKLALKKRSISNSGDRASWHENDLLLISQTGGQDEKSICFAHFASNPEKIDLPILKVLGWDNDDTGLKIDYVIRTLREKLIWPDDPSDSAAWRAQWRDAFSLKNREVIQSSKELAVRLGQLAILIRTRLRELLAIENDQGSIKRLMSVFRENLISDLDGDSFSDMYAQTIAYGLLSMRIVNPKANTAAAVFSQIPITNPFLRDLMETFLNVGGRSHRNVVGLDFDELGINEVVGLLDNTNMEAVLYDFGDRNQQEDPVMHFFEGFLQEYDAQIKKNRGVFYTPQPVVSFIVRSVDERLRTKFDLEDGLADTISWGEIAERVSWLEIPKGTSPNEGFVQILDPAAGTGTFLVEAIDLIYKTMSTKWRQQGNRGAQIEELWNKYVSEHLLPRLHGYELMMAPYAIAHLKIGLKLSETGYRFDSHERAHLYLTNGLERPRGFSGTFEFATPSLESEVKATNQVKSQKRFTVVIGNPPYNVSSLNKNEFILELMESYKKSVKDERNIQPLQDDYVKFFRFSQDLVDKSGIGIIALVSNNTYLSGLIFRGMRESLKHSFPEMSFVNLNGNAMLTQRTDDGGRDENIFDISVGVAVSFLSRTPEAKVKTQILDIKGSRKLKFASLGKHLGALTFKELTLSAPGYLFIEKNYVDKETYEKGWKIDEIFVDGIGGVKTHRDKFVYDFDKKNLEQRIRAFRDHSISDEVVRETYSLKETKSWKVSAARRALRSDKRWDDRFVQCLYKPFDLRHLYYSSDLVDRPRESIMSNMLQVKGNVAILAMRQVVADSPYTHFFATQHLVDNRAFFSNRGIVNLYPLYKLDKTVGVEEKKHNISQRFLNFLKDKFGYVLAQGSEGDLMSSIGVKDIFNYVYAVGQSSRYREKYDALLRDDFPRIPVTGDKQLFKHLVDKGNLLVSVDIDTVDEKRLDPRVIFPKEGSNLVERIHLSKEPDDPQSCRLYINKEQYFAGVSEEVFDAYVGGYKVCERWLKDRQHKILSAKEVSVYCSVIKRLAYRAKILEQLDLYLKQSGDWVGELE